ncbi:MAG: hypothetical protein P8N72_14080 [Flavimaricola sp.]|nr:hypothetical protein [Flavimaricola sp.]
MFTWGEAKRLSTLQTRDIDFANADRLDLAAALIRPDIRHDYGEPRFRALAMLDALKRDGKGWQTRANAAQRRALGL